MKFRSEATTSERQLLLAMDASGRPVTLAGLARWRKDGLLPPLAAHGLGKGRGKTYYWREPNILPQARAAFDLLARYGRPDAVIRMLWLSGFTVPLPQLRRAWLHQLRMTAKPRRNKAGAHDSGGALISGFASANAAPGAGRLLLGAVLALCGVVGREQMREQRSVIPLIEHALARLGHRGRADCGKIALERLWTLICLLGSSPEAAAMIDNARDAEMLAAQAYLSIAARFVQSCSGEASETGVPWSRHLAEQLGVPLFTLILALVRSGADEQLERIAADMQDVMGRRPARRERASPVQAAASYA